MIIKQADFIKESSVTSGTGTLTLVQLTGFGRFSSAFAENDIVPYILENGNNRETGFGTVGVSNTLARTTVLSTIVAGTYNNTNPTAISLQGTTFVSCGPISEVLKHLDVYSISAGIKTNSTASYTVVPDDYTIIQDTAGAVYTLPVASLCKGRILHLVNQFAGTITSDASNVVPLAGGSAGTDIISAVAGKFAKLQSNGTYWQIIEAN